MTWQDNTPIYLQLREKIIHGILSGQFPEGAVIPSIRQVAQDYEINPLTVSKAFQSLVDDHILEKKRGLGMFVTSGAATLLHQQEKVRFLQEEWPLIKAKIKQLGLSQKELFS